MISSTILFVDKLPFLQKFPHKIMNTFFVFVKKRKLLSSSYFFIFGTEVLISLISSLGGWWGCGRVVFLAKGTTSRTLVFLISDKKRNLQINKNGHFEKKGNFREPVAKFDK